MATVTDVRSAALRGFRAVVTDLGGDADSLAEAVGLSAEVLDIDDQLIAARSLVELLEHAANTLDCPDLGLRVASRQDVGTLGPLALALQACATAGEALDCAVRFLFVHSHTVTLTTVPDPYEASGVVALRYDIGDNPVTNQGIDLGIGFLHRALKELVGGRYGLRSVELPHHPRAPLSVYESFFDAPVHVDTAVGLLRVPAGIRKQPLKSGGNTHLRQLAEAFLAEQFPDLRQSATAPRVRTAIHQTLGTTPVTVSAVASILAMHPRTLQRHLASENTSFATLLDDVRRNSARRYLTGSDMPMSQVAALLGLSEQAALTHSCRRWWSMTPTDVRHSAL